MASVDKEFVEKLDAFTDALGDVVELLKAQTKKDTTDVVSKSMDSMPDKIIQMSEDLATVKKDVSSLKSSTDDIKKSIQEIKKSKETGMFGKVSETDNKKKIIDGISVIGLIAGGVLAVGLAFKIIGKVDFLSVLALSASVTALAFSFVMVAKSMKDNKLKSSDVLMVSAVLPIMAAGLMLSSLILSNSATIGVAQGISILIVSVALGAALFFMSKALTASKMKGKHTSQFLLLPIILPAIALGIMLSTNILKGSSVLSLKQLVSVAVVSIALGASLFFMSKAISASKMEGKHTSQFLLLPIILPAIALGIAASSLALELVNGNIDLMGVLKASLAVGISVLVMMPTIILINKFKIKTNDIIRGSFAILALSGVVVLSSKIISEGDYTGNVPDYQWSLKVGLSMLVFGGTAFILGKLPKNALIQGMIAMALLVPTIWLADWIISKGDYSKYPSIDWSLGVGLSMLVFGTATAALGFIAISGVGAGALALGMIAVIGISALMYEVDKIVSLGIYKNYPKDKWVESIGKSMLVFGTATVLLGAFALATFGFGIGAGLSAVLDIADTMVEVDKKLSKGKWGAFPPMEWSESVGLSLMSFTKAIANNSPGLLDKFGSWLFGEGENENPLLSVATSMKSVATELNGFDWENAKYPSKKWALGVGAALTAFSLMEIGAGVGKAISGILSLIGGGSGSPLEDLSLSMVQIAKNMNDPIWNEVKEYGGYPSEEWAKGVSMALTAFSSIMSTLDDIGESNGTFGQQAIIIVAGLKQVANYMDDQDWNEPNVNMNKWGESVSNTVDQLIGIFEKIDKADYERGDRKGFEYIFSSINMINRYLNVGKWHDVPNTKWTNGLKSVVDNVVPSFEKIDKADYERGDRKGFEYIFSSINAINDYLDVGKWNKLPSDEWSEQLRNFVYSIIPVIIKIKKSNYNFIDRDGLENLIETAIILNNKLNDIKWNKLPSDEWSEQLKTFVYSIIPVVIKIKKSDYNFVDRDGLENLLETAIILNNKLGMKWNDLPSIEWSEQLKFFVYNIIPPLLKIKGSDYGESERVKLINLFVSISKINEELGKNKKWNQIDSEWSKNVISSIKLFTDINQSFLFDMDDNLDIFEGITEINESIGKNKKWNQIDGDWSKNVISSIKLFTDINQSFLFDMDDNLDIFEGITDINEELGKNKKWNQIDSEWSKNITSSIKLFTDLIGKKNIDLDNVFDIFEGITDINETLGKNKKWNSIDPEWTKSLSIVFDTIMSVSPELLTNTDDIVQTFDKLSKLGESSDNFKTLADSIKYVAESLKDIDTDVMNRLSNFSGNMLVLSLVDETRLNEFIDVIDDRKEDLKDIISLGNMGPGGGDVKTSISQMVIKTDEEDKKQTENRFETLITEIQKLNGLLNSINGNVDITNTMNSASKMKNPVPVSLV